MSQISRDNHFVPQLYLKHWSKDGHRILSYRILVSNNQVPKWELRSIRGVAFHRDLYTEFSNHQEVDEFEKWLESEYEAPAQESLVKVLQDKKLESSDWERLALLLGAQDVRTPTNYLESMEQWNRTLPPILENTLKNAVSHLESTQQENHSTIESNNREQSFFKDHFNIQVLPSIDLEPDKGQVGVSVMLSRSFWLESQRFLLSKTANSLLKHKWSIVKPSKGNRWFTCDHPVVRLNYYGDGTYDLKGGWDNKGGNLFMPLSPQHLLFTEIGSDLPDRFVFSPEKTLIIQKFLAEKALRWIFAYDRMNVVPKLRPRHIDPVAFKAEQEQWKNWHNEQSKAESLKDIT
jgi:hypothetical protein